MAGFPVVKTLEEFNYDLAKGVKRSRIEELAGLGFKERHENVVLVRPSGVGKTHLALWATRQRRASRRALRRRPT